MLVNDAGRWFVRKRLISSRLSADVFDFLSKRGLTLTEIGAAIGATKSFISRVRSGERGLTVDHLIALEQKVGEPLPLLLLRATPIESVRKDLRPLYRMTEKMLARTSGRKSRPARRRSKAA